MQKTSVSDSSDCDFYIVGIGASAGGLESLEQLFGAMGDDTGMAFVVVQHLSPDFNSQMDRLLSRKTTMPVQIVQDGVTVEPNHVYLIPPRKEMIISDGRLLLTEKDSSKGLSLPIDHFFRSLAQDAHRFSVGIVLSGTGSDGSRGVQDIHEAGGLVIAQEPETARFDGMPCSTIASGAADIVLAPDAIPAALTNYVTKSLSRTELGEAEVLPATEPLTRILDRLHAELGLDFALYKPSTVGRRTERRVALRGLNSVEEYADLLEHDDQELNALSRDLLIGVTRFFRDRAAFRKLEEQIDQLVKSHDGSDGIRAWVAGCATGEEAYSVAILFMEAMKRHDKRVQLSVFATDVHPRSLRVAAAGVYDEVALSEVSEERKHRYFEEDGTQYRVRKPLRKALVFARHNLLTDAPFTRMDLVTCRNLLIYLQPPAQRKALSLFHFSLRPEGLLMLGSSESLGDLEHDFDTIDTKWRIFRKRSGTRVLSANAHSLREFSPAATKDKTAAPARALLALYDSVLDEFLPPGMLVDDHNRVVHVFPGGENYLQMRPGRPSSSVLDLITKELRTSLSGAIQHARRTSEAVRYKNIRIGSNDAPQLIDLEVHPVQPRNCVAASHLLVTFKAQAAKNTGSGEDHATVTADAGETEYTWDVRDAEREQIQHLESELALSQENLQATVEELETSNEELQATNEELVASNEELQSTNEELNSVNEELHSVNEENQRRIAELTQLSQDMQNLLHSSEVGVMFLDRELRVRHFTPPVAGLFYLQPQDAGRPIEHFGTSLDYPDLIADLERVLADGVRIEREVQDRGGVPFLLRIVPYDTPGGSDGLILTFFNISTLKRQADELRRYELIVRASEEAIISKTLEGVITHWNRGAEVLYGYSESEALGQHIQLIVPDDRLGESEEILKDVAGGKAVRLETVRLNKAGERIDVQLSVSPLIDNDGNVIAATAIAHDITEQKKHESRLIAAQQMAENANRAKSEFLSNMSHEIRTPMTSVVGLAELLRDQETDPSRAEPLDLIVSSGRHLLALINDILDLSRVESGTVETTLQRCDPAHVLCDVIELMQVSATEKDLGLEWDFADAIPATIQSDPRRLRQILMNIIGNAVKFTQNGHVVTTVRVDDDQTPHLVFEVSDTGPGIPEDDLPRLFEPFTRTGTAADDGPVGTGLGLYISRRLAESLGGTLTVSSRVGEGSTFTLRVPTGVLDDIQFVQPQQSSEEFSLWEESRDTPQPIHLRVLLAEDTRAISYLLKRVLQSAGAEVTAVENGKQAVSAVADAGINGSGYDLVLMDMSMPVLDGYRAAEQLRQRGYDGPILALTASAMQGDRERCLQSGCTEYLTKPIEKQLLLSTIRRVTSTSHA